MDILSRLTGLSSLVELMVGIGVLFLGSGYAWGQFFGGKRKAASEQTIDNTNLIKGLQEQISGLDTLVERGRTEGKAAEQRYHEEIKELTGEVGKLKGIIQEKETKLAEYKEIFQGRNPQLEEFIKASLQHQEELAVCMESINKFLVSSSQVKK